MAVRSVVCLLSALVVCPSGQADIYAYTDADGSVSLSNVPADARYAVLVAAPAPPASAVAAPSAVPASSGRAPTDKAARAASHPFAEVVEDAARAAGVEAALLHAVIAVESSHNPRAVSKKGAAGLMQLMPATAKRYGVADAFDPAQNVAGGARYLRDLLALFDRDLSLALAAFNAGENAVLKHGKRIPPYRETQAYVPRVLDHYARLRARSAP